MIGYLRGTVNQLFIDCCFIDVQGVGYRVFIATTTRNQLIINNEVTLFTYLNVREDAMQLYGFYTQMEYDIFIKLISVSGIGPKVALGILSAITVEKLCQALGQKQVSILTKLPGIGKKTAERLILELEDKIGAIAEQKDALENVDSLEFEGKEDVVTETTQALISLGYTQAEFMPILKNLKSIDSVESAIKFVLKEFAKR
ncbi:Holliday junction branch migration protein RuvA [Anaerosinus gibii]|uniref:Holliday junction branch migration complex subunit RuvA n=1 Tax=Selenobaculum gibii TaxID=3054208 RepID=A0A9Y2AKP9_9FIRM|nr:Holliday junction branch migration protein RuvA [Selenobaculum gbiensis]WIW71767.1 Holliday junction branch migration protein RuvA [Selenobaculum gbiensis]